MTSKIQSVLIPKEKSKLHAVNFPKTGFTLKQSHKLEYLIQIKVNSALLHPSHFNFCFMLTLKSHF